MDKLTYIKSPLLKTVKAGTVLLHTCDTTGSWKSPISLKLKKKYPNIYSEYQSWCSKNPNELIGSYLKFKDDGVIITCLFTGTGQGDTKELMLRNTQKAIRAFIQTLPYKSTVNSTKINPGLFNVPWDYTEKVIKACLSDRPDIQWIIYEV